MHNNLYWVCGIDPGQNTGVSMLGFDNYFNIVDVNTYCLHLPTEVYQYSKSMSRAWYLNTMLTEILNNYNPCAVGIELPFQHRFANAVIQLSQYLSTIETSVYTHNPYLLNYRYPPKMVKKLIGATGNGDKNAVSKALTRIPELDLVIKNNILTEHEADATAIAYITLDDIKKYPYKLLMNTDNFNYFRT